MTRTRPRPGTAARTDHGALPRHGRVAATSRAAALGGAALLLGACSWAAGPDAATSTTDADPYTGAQTVITSDEAVSFDAYSAYNNQFFNLSAADTVAGEVTGTVADPAGEYPTQVTVTVRAVVATSSSTVLQWSVAGADGDDTYVAASALADPVVGDSDTSGVTVVDTAADLSLSPTSVATDHSGTYRCLCTGSLVYVGSRPELLSTQYPALPTSTTQVEVRVPGLDPVTVAVTRP